MFRMVVSGAFVRQVLLVLRALTARKVKQSIRQEGSRETKDRNYIFMVATDVSESETPMEMTQFGQRVKFA